MTKKAKFGNRPLNKTAEHNDSSLALGVTSKDRRLQIDRWLLSVCFAVCIKSQCISEYAIWTYWGSINNLTCGIRDQIFGKH